MPYFVIFTRNFLQIYRAHKQYYDNVKPKVITRWLNGTPKIRNGKIQRRMSDTFLIQPKLSEPPQQPPLVNNLKIHEEDSDEDDDGDDVFDESQEQEAGIETLNNSSQKLKSVIGHFKDLFSRLDEYTKNRPNNEFERAFVQRQMRMLTEQVQQVDYMITEIVERSDRLEKFFKNREQGLDWNQWKE